MKKYNIEIETINLSIIAYFNMNKNETLGIRSELDALPIKESFTHQIRSKNDNMHACGHDIHTSALLSLCDHISKNKYNHNIALIFQSKEESGLGSKDIVESGLLSKFNITKIIAFHVWPNLEEDHLFSNKKLMFGSYELDVKIEGKSNHVSTYKKDTDAIHASFKLYNKLANLKGNNIAHLGKIESGKLRNISASESRLNYSIRFKSNNKIKDKIQNMKIKSKCNINYFFSEYYPPLTCSKYLLDMIPHSRIKTLKSAEDFGYYNEFSKTIYLLYGLGKGFNLHTSDFQTTYKQRKNYLKKVKETIDIFLDD